MDLGCLDLCCISHEEPENKQRNGDASAESATATSKIGKFKTMKESGQSPVTALNKLTSQIRKSAHRKSSPLNWFPRKKVDSYLIRKIKLLQEVGGMNLTLDETLGDSNPHYSRVLREKIAAREAACKAMEARKAALVEASWCRILRAARIQNKEAEALLLKAEKNAAEAFEAATAIGVIMYDKPNCSLKRCEIETSSVDGGKSTTHTVTASFETAFEVDKEVAAAVKSAFVRLANCPSLNKDEFKDLLRKISQNPDVSANNQELSEVFSECESESGSELETEAQANGCSSKGLDCRMPISEAREKRYRKKQSPEKLKINLVDMMVERLRCLQEDELSSLATIVATCGLSAALAEVENCKPHDVYSVAAPALGFPRRLSSLEDAQTRRKQIEPELPSLDKFLVKRMSKLEREVQEARKNQSRDETGGNPNKTDDGKVNSDNNVSSSETVADLGSILVKHSSKFEKEIEEAKKNNGKAYENINGKKFGRKGMVVSQTKEDTSEVPSLDKFLVKRVSRLEKEVQEAKIRRKNDPTEGGVRVTNMKAKVDFSAKSKNTASCADGDQQEKENINSNKEVDGKTPDATTICTGESVAQVEELKTESKEVEDSLEKILVKPPVHGLEREKVESSLGSNNGYRTHKTRRGGNVVADCESLDKVLVKHVSRLEKEKMKTCSEEEVMKVKRTQTNVHSQTNEEGGLDQILVKPKSRLEREKLAASEQASSYGYRNKTRLGGNAVPDCESLDKVLVKHVSRLEKEKMKAKSEEEAVNVKKSETTKTTTHSKMNEEGGLDQILVKHKSRLEREKIASSTAEQPGDQTRHSSVARKEARDRELREAWDGLSLGNSVRPHLSKLEREKAAWIKAEEEERSRVL